MSATRIPCCVPFCRRTRPEDGRYTEWVCSAHWMAVPAGLKRRKREVERLLKRRRARAFFSIQGLPVSCTKNEPRYWATVRLADKIWQRCKEAAIERAAGIS